MYDFLFVLLYTHPLLKKGSTLKGNGSKFFSFRSLFRREPKHFWTGCLPWKCIFPLKMVGFQVSLECQMDALRSTATFEPQHYHPLNSSYYQIPDFGDQKQHYTCVKWWRQVRRRVFLSMFLFGTWGYQAGHTNLQQSCNNVDLALTISLPNFRRHLSSAFVLNKLLIRKKFICKTEEKKLNDKQLRSRWDGSSHLDLCCLQKPIIIACGSERVEALTRCCLSSSLLLLFPKSPLHHFLSHITKSVA